MHRPHVFYVFSRSCGFWENWHIEKLNLTWLSKVSTGVDGLCGRFVGKCYPPSPEEQTSCATLAKANRNNNWEERKSYEKLKRSKKYNNTEKKHNKTRKKMQWEKKRKKIFALLFMYYIQEHIMKPKHTNI